MAVVFTFLNKQFKAVTASLKGSRRKTPRSLSGQVAIVLILVTAIVLILYAVVLNFSRASQLKTFVTVSANVTASQLASLMASYGESVFRIALGGQRSTCGLTGAAAAFLTVTIIVIAIIIAYIAPGSGLFLLSLIPVAIALALALAAALIQMVHVNPGLTQLWNKMMSEALVPEDQFLERGIQAGLQSSVSDSAEVWDIHDSDLDGFYETDPVTQDEADFISRYGHHYTERIKRYKPLDIAGVEQFRDGLFNFLYLINDNGLDWGLYDPPGCPPDGIPGGGGNPCCRADLTRRPAICNHCCVPKCYPSSIDPCPPNHPFRIRPAECDDLLVDPDVFCAQASPNPLDPGSPFFSARLNTSTNPFIYEPYLDNLTNNRTRQSFRELIGRDDQHRMFRKGLSVFPGGQQEETVEPTIGPPLITSYRHEDTSGYNSGIWGYTSGVYGVLYELRDWEVDLAVAEGSGHSNGLECAWTDPAYPAQGGVACPGYLMPTQPARLSNLVLPRDPSTLPYNPTAYVDGTNRNIGGPSPIRPDIVGTVNNLVAADNECAWGYPDAPNAAPHPSLWKPGTDRYCSVAEGTRIPGAGWQAFVGQGGTARGQPNPSGWPYWSQCPKSGAWGTCTDPNSGEEVDCACPEVPGLERFSGEDSLDEIIFGLTDFIEWSDELLKRDLDDLITHLTHWYPSAAQWIEPAGGGFLNNPTDGGLWIWYYELQNWQRVLDAWVNANWMVADWRDAWCAYDKTQPPPYVNAEEESTWSGDEVDINEVIACLRWNVEDVDVKNGATLTGNAEKFWYCYNGCGTIPGACDNLPRSLVPNFDPSFSVSAGDKALLQNCKALGDSGPGNWYHDSTEMGLATYYLGIPPYCSGPAFEAALARVLGRTVPFTPPQSEATINAIRACSTCQGQGGQCGPAGSQVVCNSGLLQVNAIEAAKRTFGGYGSCWEWSIQDRRFYGWGEPGNTNGGVITGNTSYYAIMNAMGTCPYKSIPGNSFTQAMVNAFTTADPAHQTQFIRCELGCQAFSATVPICDFSVQPPGFIGSCLDCLTLPFQNAAGTIQYNLEPFFPGIANPLDPSDQADIVNFFGCLTGACTQANCSSVSNGGPLPEFNSIGTPYYPPGWRFIPPNDPNALAIASGYDACASQPPPPTCEGAAGTCGPGGVNAGLPRLTCSDPHLTKSMIERQVCNAAGSFCDEWQNLAGAGTGRTRHFDFGETGNAYWDDIVLAEATAVGITCDRNPDSPYMANINRSYEEAQNQVAKYQKRLDIFEGQVPGPNRGVVPQIMQMKAIIDEAVANFQAFLEAPCDLRTGDGPANCLIDAMRSLDLEIAISKQAVYAWQDEPKGDETVGKWHVSRVDIRIPGRCNDACGIVGAPGSHIKGVADRPWPWVHEETKRWSSRRCYDLWDDDRDVRGMVKARITRFDESNEGDLVTFPGGLKIWKFRFFHPTGGPPDLKGARDMDQYIRECADPEWGCCQDHMNPSGDVLADNTPLGDGAFLLDKRDSVVNQNTGTNTAQCWDAVNELLKHGVTSEACAEYYYHEGMDRGFNMKFIPCVNFL